jgi:peptide/nickel transport system permease protein
LVDGVAALPLLVLALAIVTAAGSGRWGVIAALSIAFMPLSARVARASALSLNQAGYLSASLAIGSAPTATLARHVVPNVIGPWLAVVSTQVGGAVLAEASLSFLGVGGQGSASLGAMLGREAQTYMYASAWVIVWPGLALALLALTANVIGDALAQAATPESRAARRRS